MKCAAKSGHWDEFMRVITRVLFLAFICAPGAAHADDAWDACAKIEGQQPRNACFGDLEERLDAKLKNDYASLTKIIEKVAQEYRDDGDAEDADRVSKHIALLSASQAAWQKYRQKECDLQGAYYENGSMDGEIIAECVITLTQQRDEIINSDYDVYAQDP